MIDYVNGELYQQDSVEKELNISFDGGQIKNDDIYQEEFSLEESLCSDKQVVFGSCEASAIKFRVASIFQPLIGKWLTVKQVLNGDEDNPFQFGKYKVMSDVPTGDRVWRDVTAYDSMYDILKMDVTEWYKGLSFPMTLKQFRDSFFSYVGVDQEETVLINDVVEIGKTVAAKSISGKYVITAICEANARFGHISRDGEFRYIGLPLLKGPLLPSDNLFPSDDLFPREAEEILIPLSNVIEAEYEDYVTKPFTKLQIRTNESDIGVIVGDGDTSYIIESNFLFFGKSTEALEEIANRILAEIKKCAYRPFHGKFRGNPCVEVGDPIYFRVRKLAVDSYVFQRVYTGVQSNRDEYQTDGEETWQEEVNGQHHEITQLQGKTNEIVRTVEETRLTMTDIAAGLRNEITVTASGLQANITAEKTRAEEAESSLANSISVTASGLEAKITSEETRATTAEGTITTTLTNTITATASGLQANITAEKTRAEGVESSLSTRITANANGLSAEISRATGKEESISNRITATADSLSAEITRATGAEASIRASVTEVESSISLKVSKGNVSSQLSLESGQVTISSNRLVVNSTHFKLDSSGNATFSGTVTGATITSSSLISTGTYGTTSITNGGITTNYIITNGRNSPNISIGGTSISIMDNTGAVKTTLNGSNIQSPSIFASDNMYSAGSPVITVANRNNYYYKNLYNEMDYADWHTHYVSIGNGIISTSYIGVQNKGATSFSPGINLNASGIYVYNSSGILIGEIGNSALSGKDGGAYFKELGVLDEGSTNNIHYVITGEEKRLAWIKSRYITASVGSNNYGDFVNIGGYHCATTSLVDSYCFTNYVSLAAFYALENRVSALEKK